MIIKEEFKLDDDAYLINKIEIGNFDKAVEFRNKLLESDWSKAENIVKMIRSFYLMKQCVLLQISNSAGSSS